MRPPSSNMIVMNRLIGLVGGEDQIEIEGKGIPGVVRYQECCVQDQAHTVIHILPLAERLVTTFMGNNPYACAHSTLRRTQFAPLRPAGAPSCITDRTMPKAQWSKPCQVLA